MLHILQWFLSLGKPPEPWLTPIPEQPKDEVKIMQALHLRKSKRSISKLIFHHFGTQPPEGMNTAKIRVMHINKGWSDIGYHGVIMPDGEFQLGRDIDKMGAHTRGSNKGSIGIMFMAGLKRGHEFTKPTQAQLITARLIIEEQKRHYQGLEIFGHRDRAATLCPGFDIRHWYETNEVRA